MMKSTTRFLVLGMLLMIVACKSDDAASGGALADGELDLKKIETALARYEATDSSMIASDVLRGSLPDVLLGMTRIDLQGQQSEFFGFGISTAEATYTEGDRKLNVNLIDTGGAGNVLSGLAGWADMKVNKESADGYERSVLIDGQKAYERYSKADQSGELLVLAGDRLIISLTGKGIGPDDLQKGLRKIRLKL